MTPSFIRPPAGPAERSGAEAHADLPFWERPDVVAEFAARPPDVRDGPRPREGLDRPSWQLLPRSPRAEQPQT